MQIWDCLSSALEDGHSRLDYGFLMLITFNVFKANSDPIRYLGMISDHSATSDKMLIKRGPLSFPIARVL